MGSISDFVNDAVDSVSGVIDDVVDTVGDVVGGVIDFAGDVVEEVVSWIIPEVPELPELNLPDAEAGALGTQGLLLNKRASDTSLPLIYGTRRIGGNIVFIATSNDNQFLYLIMALCEGQVARFTELYIDDELYATFTGSDSTFGTKTLIESMSDLGLSTLAPTNTSGLSIETSHPAYQGTEEIDGTETTHYLTNFTFFNGTDDGHYYQLGVNSFSFPQSLFSLGWQDGSAGSKAHLGKGICHAAFRFKYNSDAFNGIPKINFVIRGKLINTNLSGSTYAYSANPAYILYDYLTGTRYGKGLSSSDIDTASFTTAAGVCNTSVTPFTGASSQSLFETHAALGSNTKILNNVQFLLSSFRGFFTYTGGKYTVKVEGTGSSAMTITEDMIISSIQVIGENKNEKYNRVIATFPDENNNYQTMEAIYPPVDETNVASDFKYATLLSSDNNQELHFNINLPSTTNFFQAEDLAELVLKRSRTGLRIQFVATSEAQELTVGDIFAITHTGMGFSAKNFLVTKVSLSVAGTVGISAVEYVASVYTYNTKIQQSDAPTTFLPNPKVVNAPSITSISDELVNVTEGNINVLMTVTLKGTPDFFVDKFEVVYKKSTETIYKTSGISSATVRQIAVESGQTYNVRARAINSLGYKSSFVTEDHFVVGASDPPANVSGVSIDYQVDTAVLRWTPSTDLDLAYYEVRYNPLTSSSNTLAAFNNSVILFDKVAPPTNQVLVPLKAGTFYVSAFDLLGHQSTNLLANGNFDTGILTIGTISSVSGASTVATITESTAFTGTTTNTVSTGNSLILDSNGNFDDASGNVDDAVGLFDAGSGVISSGEYEFANQFSLGAKYEGRVDSAMTVNFLDYINNFDSYGQGTALFDTAQGLFDSAGSVTNCNAKLQISTSDDNSTYTGFTDFIAGNYAFRFAKFKVLLSSGIASQTPEITALQVFLQMRERTDTGSNIASGTDAAGKTVTFGTAFFAEPSVTIAAQNLATGDFFTITSKSATAFTIEFFNSSGSTIDRTFDYVATGEGRAI